MTKYTYLKPIIISVIASFLIGGITQAATFEMSPTSETFYYGCPNRVYIEANVIGEESNAADIEIYYNPSEVTIIDSNPDVPGIQIGTGNAYQAYFGNDVNESSGIIRLAAASFMSYLNSQKTFAYIEFESNPGFTGSSDFEINFDAPYDTLDSNIAETGTSDDLLDSVSNGSYSFTEAPFGSCVADTTAPSIIFVDPTPSEQNVPDTADITINITDAMSGVDLTSIEFIINGEHYTTASPEVSTTGSLNDYTFVINPRVPLLPNTYNTVVISATDVAGNIANSQSIFNAPPVSTPRPTPRPTFTPLPTTTQVPTIVPTVIPAICPVCEECTLELLVSKIGTTGVEKELCERRFMETLTDKTIEEVPELNNLVSGGVLLGGFLSYFMFLNTPGLLLNMIGLLLGKKQKNPWGVVMDAGTRKAISLSVCKLYIGGTTNMINQTISDTDGVYGFTISPGSYRLEVHKSGYDPSIIKFVIDEGEQGYGHDVLLVKTNLKAHSMEDTKLTSKLGKAIKGFFKKAYGFLFIFGLFISIISTMVSPSPLNYVILITYFVIGILTVLYKTDLKPKYSAIIDHTTSLRIPNALIKIFNTESGKLIDTKLSNAEGFFDYWGEEGDYAITASVRGYSFPSEVQSEYEKFMFKGVPMLKIHLAQGKNKLKLLVDPVE